MKFSRVPTRMIMIIIITITIITITTTIIIIIINNIEKIIHIK